ncbi:hypothetical protein EDB80DRAFT_867941 [Ilyonectria destructans]|nr:hypothetical protein EDB80DRAFT_867941 [Ilyonectria destructans]
MALWRRIRAWRQSRQPSGPDPLQEVGVALGLFAKCFGARAPVDWIANQLFEDLAFGFFPRVQDGIHVALIEWWLLDEDFILGLDAHDEWRELQLDLMIDRWIDFYEDWCGQRHGTVGYKIAKAKLEHMEERLHADIEKEAIEIGL